MSQKERPVQLNVFKYPLGSEFQNIYKYLSRLDVGEVFRFYYDDSNKKLHLQARTTGRNLYSSIATFDTDGNVALAGTLSQSQTLTNPGSP